MQEVRKKEVEVFGVSYDRYMLLQLQKQLTRELKLKTIVEMPSHGAKAAGSLYSITGYLQYYDIHARSGACPLKYARMASTKPG